MGVEQSQCEKAEGTLEEASKTMVAQQHALDVLKQVNGLCMAWHGDFCVADSSSFHSRGGGSTRKGEGMRAEHTWSQPRTEH